MKINGKELTFENGKMDMSALFDKEVLDNLPETMPEEINPMAKFEIKESNIKADIPMRFAESRFGEYDYPFLQKLIALSVEPNDKVGVIFGPVGVGKTTLLASAIHERAARGLECGLYFNIRMLAPKLRTSRSFSAKENEEMLYSRLSKVPFLCLDEVGTCPNLKEESEFLTTLLCQRFDNCLPTLIATNLSPSNFKLLLCNIDPKSIDNSQKKEMVDNLEMSNPTLNRIMSIAIGFTVTGPSHRGEK